MKKILLASIIGAFILSGCTRISDGEVGVRVTTGGTIEGAELKTGFHQSVFGVIKEFPVRDLTVLVDNKQPLTQENTALQDLDISIIYSVNQDSVAELFKTKARSFHKTDQQTGDVYLMYAYIETIVNNAVYKAVRKYSALTVADNRVQIENDIKSLVLEELTAQKLNNAIQLTAVQIRNIQPNAEILKSATDLVRSQNDLKVKENEIKIAEAEAKRQAALAQNAGQSIAYMKAQSELLIAQAIKDGKVQTIVVPHGMSILNMQK